MLFITRWFGVTGCDADRDLAREQSDIEGITESVLLMQANAAAKQHRPLARGTHAKGVSVRAEFEVFDVTIGRDAGLAARLAKGMFATPGVYPAVVRFGNSDSKKSSDFKGDIRSLAFSVDLTRGGTAVSEPGRQDFSMQNATTLPINDSPAMNASLKLLATSNPAACLWSMPFKDKLRVLRTAILTEFQYNQPIKPYQQMRYWSNVPFRHGAAEVAKYSAIPSPDNLSRPLQKNNPNGLQDELIRHVQEDSRMSSFNFGIQLLDTERMTYWGKRQDANFWIENASIEWKEAEAPFHLIARLTLLPKSHLGPDAAEATYIDVCGNSTPDRTPLGSINRARGSAEGASRKARMRGRSSGEPS